MDIIRQASAGTLESSDCMITVSPYETIEIILDSISKKRFGMHLMSLINQTLSELDVKSGKVEIVDRGALDYCLRARIVTAIKRSAA